MKPRMTTWMSQIATALGNVDLTQEWHDMKPCDEGDTQITDLSEELQALYRLRENARVNAERYLGDLEQLRENHLADSHKNEEACQQYQESSEAIKQDLDEAAREYFNLTHLFMIEIQEEHGVDFAQILVVGVREGKVLVTRQDNAQGDYSKIDCMLFGDTCKLGYANYSITLDKEIGVGAA